MYNVFLPNINLIQRLPLTVLAVGEHEQQQKVIRENGYPAYHLMYSQSGTGFLEIDNQKFFIPENSFFVLKPNQPHIYYPSDEDNWNTRWIVFEGDEAELFLRNLCLYDTTTMLINKDHRYNSAFDLMYKHARTNEIESLFKTSSLLMSLLIDISHLTYYDNEKSSLMLSPKIKQVLEFIHNNYHRDVSLDEMAEHIGVSKQYLCRSFKTLLSNSPYDYLINYRLKIAKELLCNPDLTVGEVSEKTGFSNISYFCHIFKKHEKMTPKEFREISYMA